jgi:hypothetical protein
MGFVQLAPRRKQPQIPHKPLHVVKNRKKCRVPCPQCGQIFKQGFGLRLHVLNDCGKCINDDSQDSHQRSAESHEASSNNSMHDEASSSSHEAPPILGDKLQDVSSYIRQLNNGCGPTELYHLTEYRFWAPRHPDASVAEQARFLGACDAGVGISDTHAQVILDYCRSRDGIGLPKTVKTCWANIERAHTSMCGPMKKVCYMFDVMM